jgi:myosin-15
MVICLTDQPSLHITVSLRGLEVPPRGWSVSLHSGDTWQDLAGCDFVLDLIGQTEDLGDPAGSQSYPITPLGL